MLLPPTGEENGREAASVGDSACQCSCTYTCSPSPYHKIIRELFSLLFIEMEMGSQQGQSVTFKVIRPEGEEVGLAPDSVQFQRFCSG